MATMYIAYNNCIERGCFLGDVITMIKAAELFVRNEPADTLLLSLFEHDPMNFLWLRFVRTNNVTVLWDDGPRKDRTRFFDMCRTGSRAGASTAFRLIATKGPEKGISPINRLLDLSPFLCPYPLFFVRGNDMPVVAWAAEFELRGLGFQAGEPKPADADSKKHDRLEAYRTAHPLVWGEPTNGLRAAHEVMATRAGVVHGDRLQLNVHLWNVSDKPISFASKVRLHNPGAPGAVVKNENPGAPRSTSPTPGSSARRRSAA